jgi:hypothetical protein
VLVVMIRVPVKSSAEALYGGVPIRLGPEWHGVPAQLDAQNDEGTLPPLGD